MKWINVKDEKPRPYREVIVCCEFMKVYCTETYIHDGEVEDVMTYLNRKIKYWMPLPEAPNE